MAAGPIKDVTMKGEANGIYAGDQALMARHASLVNCLHLLTDVSCISAGDFGLCVSSEDTEHAVSCPLCFLSTMRIVMMRALPPLAGFVAQKIMGESYLCNNTFVKTIQLHF